MKNLIVLAVVALVAAVCFNVVSVDKTDSNQVSVEFHSDSLEIKLNALRDSLNAK